MKPKSERDCTFCQRYRSEKKDWMKHIAFIFFLAFMSACAAQPDLQPPASPTVLSRKATAANAPVLRTVEVASNTPTLISALSTTAETTPEKESTPRPCQLTPIIIPTKPTKTPRSLELDYDTGLHMTGTAQEIDLASYRLKVTGRVDHPLSLSYDELRCMPKVTATPTLKCVGIFEDVATWSGVPIKYILGLASVQNGAQEIKLISADGYEVKILLGDASNEENFLAYELSGKPLPILHGFPLRAVFPSMLGFNWVKWLVEIQIG
jgi:DMSO/TMAO reductase YedYZ molybdopterin-dependent catalytic subunit